MSTGVKMQDLDFDYFVRNLDDLYQTYGHKFLAIKNFSVLGVYDSFDEALDTTMKTEQLGTFLIQECLDSREKLVRRFQSNVMPVRCFV